MYRVTAPDALTKVESFLSNLTGFNVGHMEVLALAIGFVVVAALSRAPIFSSKL